MYKAILLTLVTLSLFTSFVTADECDHGCVAACYMVGGDYE